MIVGMSARSADRQRRGRQHLKIRSEELNWRVFSVMFMVTLVTFGTLVGGYELLF